MARKWLVLGVAALLIAGVSLFALRAPESRPESKDAAPQALEFLPSDLYRVRREPLERTLPLTGTLRPLVEAEVRAKVAAQVLEVTVRGPIDAETGMVIDLKELKDVMTREVEARFDHRSLTDDTRYFAERPATPETFAALIFELLDAALPAGLLHRVRLSPTADLTVEVAR